MAPKIPQRIKAHNTYMLGLRDKKILIGIIIIVIGAILFGSWLILDELQEKRLQTELKTCSIDSDCIVVGTIKGLEHIPTMDEGCECQCVTAINKKLIGLWEQKQNEFKNVECLIQCKPCVLDETNSISKCENNQCVVKSKFEPEFIIQGRYRFTFTYGINNEMAGKQTIYSNEFTIK